MFDYNSIFVAIYGVPTVSTHFCRYIRCSHYLSFMCVAIYSDSLSQLHLYRYVRCVHLLAKSFSGGLWRSILRKSGTYSPNRSQEASGRMSNSEACSPNRSQDASGGSFATILGLARQIALRRPLDAHLQQFWGLLAKSLSGGLWRFYFRNHVGNLKNPMGILQESFRNPMWMVK